MNIRFYIDPETDLPHIFKHGITEAEVEDVVFAPIEVRRGANRSIVMIGKTDSGRILKVACSDSEGDIFVVTAFDLRGNALKAFKRRWNK